MEEMIVEVEVEAKSFHLFQREPSFGLLEVNVEEAKEPKGFHLFQREPSFGLMSRLQDIQEVKILFPSLSERAFFRTKVGVKS